MLDPSIAQHLASSDDPRLWEAVVETVLGKAVQTGMAKGDIFAQVGCCQHWIRPHQSRWQTACGDFAWPMGYDKTTTGWSYSALPELCWSAFFRWTGTGWEEARTGGRCLLLRIAIPGRTARHMQAAVHTLWTPRSPLSKEKVVQLYGFRKKNNKWLLTASDVLRPRRRH